MFIDFHAHFLYGIDDGADDLSTAVSMLTESKKQGVEYVIATPHFNRENEGVYNACMLRDERIVDIRAYTEEHKICIPEIIAGFEVDFHSELRNQPLLKNLCISGTNLLLLEMPYYEWKQNDIEALYELTLTGIKPVIAHIDRYFRHFGESVFNIFDIDAVFQLNCKVMQTISGRNFVKKIIKSGRTCVMGTDMHNATSRSCNILKSFDYALKKLAPYADDLFYANAAKLIL